jgi:hypothetical protein
MNSSSYDYTTSDEEFDMEEEEDIAMVLALHAHKNKHPKHGGPVIGWETVKRERADADCRLMHNYSDDPPIYPERYFRRRFRMGADLFKYIAKAVKLHDTFFEQRRNACGLLGHNTFQKVTAALRMMTYGIPADLVDDNLVMGENSAILCVKRFVVAIVEVFGEDYLRALNAQDTARLLASKAARRFPGMLGSID